MDGTRATGVEVKRPLGAPAARSAPARSSSAEAPSTRRSSSSCRASATPTTCAASASRRCTTCPAWGSTCRTTSRSTSSTACKQPVTLNPNLAAVAQALHRGRVAVPAQGAGRVEPVRGRRLHPQQRRRRLPEPDVPLPADRGPLRRHRRPRAGHGYQVHIGPMYSDARGTVRITSADPDKAPSILFNYLSTDQDRREWVEAIRVARRDPAQPAFEPYSSGEISPGPEVQTDEEILEWVRNDGETAYHPSCTCRMGIDDMSVVDPLTMRVHGTRGCAWSMRPSCPTSPTRTCTRRR